MAQDDFVRHVTIMFADEDLLAGLRAANEKDPLPQRLSTHQMATLAHFAQWIHDQG